MGIKVYIRYQIIQTISIKHEKSKILPGGLAHAPAFFAPNCDIPQNFALNFAKPIKNARVTDEDGAKCGRVTTDRHDILCNNETGAVYKKEKSEIILGIGSFS